MNLKVEEIAANRSFVLFWVGSGDGLDQGQEVHCTLGAACMGSV